MVFIATTHKYEAELDKKLIRERRMLKTQTLYIVTLQFHLWPFKIPCTLAWKMSGLIKAVLSIY